MKVEDVRSLRIDFTDPEAELFVNIVKKLEVQCKQPGFQQRQYTADEAELITRLSARFGKGNNITSNEE